MIPDQAPANVRFAPNSGRSTGCRRMSAFDPKRTFVELRAHLNVCQYGSSGLLKICGIRLGQRRRSITLEPCFCTGQDALCGHLKVPGGESASLALLA